jgi:hypothetical protein
VKEDVVTQIEKNMLRWKPQRETGVMLCMYVCINKINILYSHIHVYIVHSKHLQGLCYEFYITDLYILIYFFL